MKETESLATRAPEVPKTDKTKEVQSLAAHSDVTAAQSEAPDDINPSELNGMLAELAKHGPPLIDKHLDVKRHEANVRLERSRLALAMENTAHKRVAELEHEREMRKIEVAAEERKSTLEAEKERQIIRAQVSQAGAKHRRILELLTFIWISLALFGLLVFGGWLIVLGKDTPGYALVISTTTSIVAFGGGYGLGSRAKKNAEK